MSGMKRYQNPELYERLSAEYALGTLQGKARARFERLMHERPYIRYAVEVWENRFASQNNLPEVKPSAAVWQNIQAEIGAPASTAEATAAVESASGGWLSRLWSSPAIWRTATAFALVLGLTPFLLKEVQHSEDGMEMPSYVAVLESESREPMMVTMGDMSRRLVSVRMMKAPEVQQNQDIQLWALHDPKSPPIPVGLLNPNNMETHLQLTPPQWSEMEGARTFAITFEPKGGAPEGRPTGKMMYKGQCLDFI